VPRAIARLAELRLFRDGQPKSDVLDDVVLIRDQVIARADVAMDVATTWRKIAPSAICNQQVDGGRSQERRLVSTWKLSLVPESAP